MHCRGFIRVPHEPRRRVAKLVKTLLKGRNILDIGITRKLDPGEHRIEQQRDLLGKHIAGGGIALPTHPFEGVALRQFVTQGQAKRVQRLETAYYPRRCAPQDDLTLIPLGGNQHLALQLIVLHGGTGQPGLHEVHRGLLITAVQQAADTGLLLRVQSLPGQAAQ